MDKPTLRNNLQVKQENLAYPPEGNGWPEPLSDSGPEIGLGITNGKSGEGTYMDGMQTSQMKEAGHHLGEGRGASGSSNITEADDTAKRARNPLVTSQQDRGEHHAPEGQ